MPRKADPAKVDYAAELYAAGKSFREAAAEVGMDPESLRLVLKRRGVVARPAGSHPAHNRVTLPEGDICSRYEGGETELALSKAFGVSRTVIKRVLRENGIQRHSQTEIMLRRMAALTPEERAAQATAAHDAVRGSKRTEIAGQRVAAARERAGQSPRGSRHEDVLEAWLSQRGVHFIREKAIGTYNTDFAVGSVAVEILGGNWHAYRASHAQRTPYILNQGWTLLFIWVIRRAPLCAEAGEYLVTLAEEARRNPALRGQYRVIRGDGKLFASGSADDDEFPLVPPSVCGFSGRPLD